MVLKNIQAFITYKGELLLHGFNLEHLVRMVSHIGGFLNLKSLMDLVDLARRLNVPLRPLRNKNDRDASYVDVKIAQSRNLSASVNTRAPDLTTNFAFYDRLNDILPENSGVNAVSSRDASETQHRIIY